LFAASPPGAVLSLAGVPPPFLSRGALAAHPAAPWSAVLLAPGAAGVFLLSCGAQSCAPLHLALPSPLPAAPLTAVLLFPSAAAPGSWTLLVATAGAVAAVDLSGDGRSAAAAFSLPFGADAAAVGGGGGGGGGLLALGNATKLALHTPRGALLRWEWVSNVTSGDGGVYDGPITALAFDGSGYLYAGTACCVNVRAPGGAVSRVARPQGLPWGNVTALAVDGASAAWPRPRVWVGTTRGAVLYDPGAPNGGAGGALRQRFRYFYGPRWLSASAAGAPFGAGAVFSAAVDRGAAYLLTPDGGLSVLASQQRTLAEKAAAYQAALPRQLRLGQVSGCTYATFGVAEPCTTGPDDNSGLWTSLSVGAMALQALVTGARGPLPLLDALWGGVHLLERAPGVAGLFGRSVVCPNCSTGSGGVWHTSTVPGLEGYKWKGDASSDELVGHVLAARLAWAAQEAAGNGAAGAAARAALADIARYIVVNGFVLIDVTGAPTTWGRWDPATLNGARESWCDSRGLNSLEVLALLATGLSAAGGNASDPDVPLFTGAVGQLRAAGYFENAVNLKIETPSDDNFSDDELGFLAALSFCLALRDPAAAAAFTQEDVALFNASLARSLEVARPERAALWGAVGAACGAPGAALAAGDVLWNMRTWPLELTDWPANNSHRLDVALDPDATGRATPGEEGLSVLPANERAQCRWNSDVYDLDGGSGMDECDPGAFLLMYWLSRWAGLLE
jgi:hypothetical protein